MNKRLQLIIENVLSEYLDANLVSEQARKKIAAEIINIYYSENKEQSGPHAEELIKIVKKEK